MSTLRKIKNDIDSLVKLIIEIFFMIETLLFKF